MPTGGPELSAAVLQLLQSLLSASSGLRWAGETVRVKMMAVFFPLIFLARKGLKNNRENHIFCQTSQTKTRKKKERTKTAMDIGDTC